MWLCYSTNDEVCMVVLQMMSSLRAVVDKMLVFNPKTRASAAELLEDPNLAALAADCGVFLQPEWLERVSAQAPLVNKTDLREKEHAAVEDGDHGLSRCDSSKNVFSRFDFDQDGEVTEEEQALVRDEVHNAIAHGDPHAPMIVAGWLDLKPDVTIKGPQGATLPELLCKHAHARNGSRGRGASMMEMVLSCCTLSADEMGRLFILAIDSSNPNCCDFAQVFIEYGMDVNVKDSRGSSVLHRVAVDGDVDTVELLLARDAEVDPLDEDGRTPMLAAAATNTANVYVIVKRLLAKGAKKDARDKQNKNGYEIGRNAKVRKLLRGW